MTTIKFDEPDTWLPMVQKALGDPDAYERRLRDAGVEQAYWDCSGLDHVLSPGELRAILGRIEHALTGHSLQLYHGCRLHDGYDPRATGMKPSSCAGIADALLALAAADPVLKDHVDAITATLALKEYREQVRSRDGQIWFCITEKEMIEDGGVYIAFGSEFRLLILNGIDEALGRRLFHYGQPAIVLFNLPFDSYLADFKDVAAKFLFSLWIHHRLGLDDVNKPRGFSCWIKREVPAERIIDIIQAEKVYDHYNTECRWYAWDEIDLAGKG
jgi:hypothetical protein